MEWISVKDRLPEEPDKCLVSLDNGVVDFATYIPASYSIKGDSYTTKRPRWDIPRQWREVTHWMPLPKPPLGDE
jgi:hypothetical protein